MDFTRTKTENRIPFNHPQIKKIGTSINFYFYLNTERILTSTDNPNLPHL